MPLLCTRLILRCLLVGVAGVGKSDIDLPGLSEGRFFTTFLLSCLDGVLLTGIGISCFVSCSSGIVRGIEATLDCEAGLDRVLDGLDTRGGGGGLVVESLLLLLVVTVVQHCSLTRNESGNQP